MIIWKSHKVIEYGKEYIFEESDTGHKKWFYRGKIHRDYGPAMEYSDGIIKVQWFNNDNIHRNDGFAEVWCDTDRWYFLNHAKKSFYDLLFYEETERDFK
jgi:hypothetical protein